jgi:hypothetical protein
MSLRVPILNDGKYTPKEFWELVRLFGCLEQTKAYAEEIRAGMEAIALAKVDFKREEKRLTDLAAKVESDRQSVVTADDELAGYRKAFEADKTAFETKSEETRKELAADRQALVTRATALDQLQVKLTRQEAAIVEADKTSQAAADRRTADLDAREADLKAKETDYEARINKFRELAG